MTMSALPSPPGPPQVAAIRPLRERRARCAASLGIAVAVGLLLIACGGGTEVAPSDPMVEGEGFASVTIAGTDLGSTQQVLTAASPGSVRITTVVDEVVTFGPDDTATLANDDVVQAGPVAVTVTSVDGVTQYVQASDRDYVVDVPTGVLTRIPTGAIPAGASVAVDYQYRTQFLSLVIGMTFAEGQSVQVSVHDIDPEGTPPVTVLATARANPMTGAPAFFATARTGLTALSERVTYEVVAACDGVGGTPECPVANELVLADFDFGNTLDPCVSGTVRATVAPVGDSDPASRVVLDVEFDDPVCG